MPKQVNSKYIEAKRNTDIEKAVKVTIDTLIVEKALNTPFTREVKCNRRSA